MIKGGSGGAVKFLLYVLIFIIIVFAFVFLFIIPQIKEYKSSQAEYSLNSKQYEILQEEQVGLEEQLKLIKAENEKIINTFSKEFNIDDFTAYSKKYFDDVKLTKIHSDTNSSALNIYQFSANLKAQNPKRFYNFVKDLHLYEGIVKINFPITISSQNNHLEIKFNMSVYSMSSK